MKKRVKNIEDDWLDVTIYALLLVVLSGLLIALVILNK
jgi:hypothetical protein